MSALREPSLMSPKTRANVAGVMAVLVLCLAACQVSTVVSALESVVSAAEIAVPVIGAATGLNPATTSAIVTYLQQVDTAAQQAAVILAGPGTSAQKAAQIAQAFVKVAQGCNCVPAGTPAEVVAVVDGVVQAVMNFLANFKPPGKTVAVAAPALKMSAGDRAKLSNIRMRAEKNLAALKEVKR